MCVMGDAYSVLLTYDYFNKPTNVKQVVLAAIVILHLCVDSSEFVLDAPSASIL